MVGNSYPEQLLEWIREREHAPRNIHLAMFVTVRDDVRAALAEGYEVKSIWADLRERKRISCSYSRFLFHVNCMRRSGTAALRPAAARIVALLADPGGAPVPEPGDTRSGGRPKTAAGAPIAGGGVVFNPGPDAKDFF